MYKQGHGHNAQKLTDVEVHILTIQIYMGWYIAITPMAFS